MSQAVEIHYQALVDAIGMENTTQLIHGHAGLGFYTYLNFQIDEMLDDDPSMSPTIEQIFDLLKEYPEEDEKIVEIKKLTSFTVAWTAEKVALSIVLLLYCPDANFYTLIILSFHEQCSRNYE